MVSSTGDWSDIVVGEGAAGLPKHHLLGTEGVSCFRGTYILRGGGGPGTMNSILTQASTLSVGIGGSASQSVSGSPTELLSLSPEEVREDEEHFASIYKTQS